MLPDLEPTNQPTQEVEIEPIPPQEAEKILAEAMKPYLADGWRILNQNAYSARLTRGLRNKDIQVDLLGKVDIQDTNLTPVQDSGRLMAWVVLLAFLLVALALASALGIL
jgi:hypothetical protein